MKRSWVIGGAVVIIAVFSWMIFGGLRDNVVFFLTPRELLAKGPEGVDVPVRLGGLVRPGSRIWDASTLDLRFTVADSATGGDTVRVKSSGAPPQMFREGMGVIVEGRLGRDSVFHATSLMVKHSEEYRAADGKPPHDKAKTLIKPTP
jgi:cytochrome c-type biogenesis protein CcmE